MTTPTQAQIEAALSEYARVIVEIIDRKGCLGIDDRRVAMVTALTAAAEAGEQNDELVFPPKKRTTIHPSATINATIERCAQVADRLMVVGVADEIRALKEKP